MKTSYQKEKENRRFDKVQQTGAKNKSRVDSKKCAFCGRDKHTGATFAEKKEKCAAKNATCKNCKKQGHFTELCYSKKKINCIKSLFAPNINTCGGGQTRNTPSVKSNA